MSRPDFTQTLGRVALVSCILLAAGSGAFGATGMTSNTIAMPSTNVVSAPSNATLQVTVIEAVLLGLENNRSLRVERFEPDIRRTFEKQADAAFDPVLSGEVSGQHNRSQQPVSGGTELTNVEESTISGSASLAKTFATGTKISLDGTTLNDDASDADLFSTTRGGVLITQSLLQGRGVAVNLASLQQAQLDTRSTEYQLRGFSEALVARIESTYWDYALALRQIEIYTDSLKLASEQLAETRERIAVGKTAELDLFSAAAEVSSRETGLINARSDLDKTRIQFLNLLNPYGANVFQQDIALRDSLMMPKVILDDVSNHVAVALRMRPDLNETRLAIQRGDLEVVKTRNGLLPRLDLFVRLGSSGYADSFQSSAGRVNGDFYDAMAGIQFAYPLGNQSAHAQYQRAALSREQTSEILANMQQLAEMDVRLAYLEVKRAGEESASIALLVKQREEIVSAEMEKFRVGKSTTLLVAQTQRDLLVSQIRQIEAIVNYLKSFIELYRTEGSLLERRGISAPGRDPVLSTG